MHNSASFRAHVRIMTGEKAGTTEEKRSMGVCGPVGVNLCRVMRYVASMP